MSQGSEYRPRDATYNGPVAPKIDATTGLPEPGEPSKLSPFEPGGSTYPNAADTSMGRSDVTDSNKPGIGERVKESLYHTKEVVAEKASEAGAFISNMFHSNKDTAATGTSGASGTSYGTSGMSHETSAPGTSFPAPTTASSGSTWSATTDTHDKSLGEKAREGVAKVDAKISGALSGAGSLRHDTATATGTSGSSGMNIYDTSKGSTSFTQSGLQASDPSFRGSSIAGEFPSSGLQSGSWSQSGGQSGLGSSSIGQSSIGSSGIGGTSTGLGSSTIGGVTRTTGSSTYKP